MEDSFPPALVDRINALIADRGIPDLHAESLLTGSVGMAVPSGYRLIVDRISHDIPFLPVVFEKCCINRDHGHK
jgi:hypothetical protein